MIPLGLKTIIHSMLSVGIVLLSASAFALPHKGLVPKMDRSVFDKTVVDPIGRSAEIQIPIQYHPSVEKWIHEFTSSRKSQVADWLQESHRYLPFLRSELKRFGLPQELAYLVLIESGFSPFAVSHASAVGPWQFIYETGKRYGLKKNWWLDERRDFAKSTKAAILYLRDLRKMFGDWYLAMAAYNMGENGLKRRMRRSQVRNYWKLVDRKLIPLETRQYVPKFLAILFIAKSPDLYGIKDVYQARPLQWELVEVRGGTELAEVADALKITRSHLKLLNAELVRGHIPKSVKSHKIRVPRGGKALLSRSRFFGKRKRFSLRVAKRFFSKPNKKARTVD